MVRVAWLCPAILPQQAAEEPAASEQISPHQIKRIICLCAGFYQPRRFSVADCRGPGFRSPQIVRVPGRPQDIEEDLSYLLLLLQRDKVSSLVVAREP